MAEVKRQRSKIRSVINEHCIPEQGKPGEIWLARAEETFWYATVDGLIVCLTDVLNRHCAHTPPRVGPTGESIRGDKGDRGEPGKASTAPGPKGDKGDPGAASTVLGPKGDRGKDCVCEGRFAREAAARCESNLSALAARFDSLSQDFETLSRAFTSSSKKSQDYLDFLRQRVAAKRSK